jgi:hypothetical protein
MRSRDDGLSSLHHRLDGHFNGAVVLFAPDDDAAATAAARQLVDGHDVELWQLGRMIAKFEHEQK